MARKACHEDKPPQEQVWQARVVIMQNLLDESRRRLPSP